MASTSPAPSAPPATWRSTTASTPRRGYGSSTATTGCCFPRPRRTTGSRTATTSTDASADEQAERVAGRIGQHVEGLVLVVGAVPQGARTQRQRPVAGPRGPVRAAPPEVEVHLHRDVVLGPGRRLQPVDLLEGEPASPFGVDEHEPVGVVDRVGRRFVARAVLQPEQLAVELREP